MNAYVKKERLPELDLFRAFAILGVIHVHATSFAAGVDAMASPYYYLFNWANIFFKFGTPCFIFLSSFVLFYNYYNRPVNGGLISHFYKKTPAIHHRSLPGCFHLLLHPGCCA